MAHLLWLERRADELVAALAERGHQIDADEARGLIRDRMQVIGMTLAISPQTASRHHLDIQSLADAVASNPGAAMDLPVPQPDTTLPAGLLGRTITALAEAARFWMEFRSPPQAHPVVSEILGMLALLGHLQENGAASTDSAELPVAAVYIDGAARLLGATRRELVEDSALSTHAPSTGQLADAFGRDAAMLRQRIPRTH